MELFLEEDKLILYAWNNSDSAVYVIVRKISGCTEEDPCKQSVDLVASSRCDRRDRDAGAARDGFERGEQGPMPRGRLAAVA